MIAHVPVRRVQTSPIAAGAARSHRKLAAGAEKQSASHSIQVA
jgi:hypothetical protein